MNVRTCEVQCMHKYLRHWKMLATSRINQNLSKTPGCTLTSPHAFQHLRSFFSFLSLYVTFDENFPDRYNLVCRASNFHQSTSFLMQIYWSAGCHETLRRDKSAPRGQTDSPAVWDSGWEPVFVQGMGIGAGQAAVQWPGIGSTSQFWAWHTPDEIGWQSSRTCMFGQLFAWTPLKGEAPTPTEYWLLQDWETEGEVCFADTLSWGGSGIFWRHFQLQRRIVFHSKEDLSGVDAVCLF